MCELEFMPILYIDFIEKKRCIALANFAEERDSCSYYGGGEDRNLQVGPPIYEISSQSNDFYPFICAP